MDDTDRVVRANQQARAAIFAGDPHQSSPDRDGHPTGGTFNSDYPESYHEQLNERLESDPEYAAGVSQDLRTLVSADLEYRTDQDAL
jgi:hypothetical protein